MQRWPHQTDAVAKTLAAFARGVRRVLVTSPTGGGKTTVAADLTRRFWDADKAVSILTQRKLMVEQLERAFRSHGLTPGIRAAGHARSFQARVQISSVQTEWSRVFKSGEWPMHPADLAIIDEAHLHDNEQGRAFCDRVLAGGGVILGLTATPVALAGMYDELIVAGTPSELHACGALVQAIHYGPDEPDLRKHKKLQQLLARGGKVPENEAAKLLGPKVPGLFGRVYGWFKKLNPEKRPTILFGPDVGGSLWFAEKFHENGIGSAHIDGQTAWMNGKLLGGRESRDQVFEATRTGEVVVLCNRFVLREGIDLPHLSHAIFATVFGELSTYLQSGGRVLRAHPGKPHATVQDHGGNWHRFGSLNADRHWYLDGTEAMYAGLRADQLRAKLCPQCGHPTGGNGKLCYFCGLPPRDQEPCRCPGCGAIHRQLIPGRKCSLCGFQFTGFVKSRPVFTVEGELVELAGDIFPPRKVQKRQDTLAKWVTCYFRAKKASQTFSQADALFALENYYHPPRDLPLMPREPADWYRRVKDVPDSELTATYAAVKAAKEGRAAE